MENSATNKVIGEGTIQFHSHDGCITHLQDVRHVPKLMYNRISLEALYGEGFDFSSEDDLMNFFKDAHVKFQAERVGNIYILLKFEGYSWWIAIIFSFKIGGYGTIEDCDGFEFGYSILS